MAWRGLKSLKRDREEAGEVAEVREVGEEEEEPYRKGRVSESAMEKRRDGENTKRRPFQIQTDSSRIGPGIVSAKHLPLTAMLGSILDAYLVCFYFSVSLIYL